MYQVGQIVALLAFDHFLVVRCLELKEMTVCLNLSAVYHRYSCHHYFFVDFLGLDLSLLSLAVCHFV